MKQHTRVVLYRLRVESILCGTNEVSIDLTDEQYSCECEILNELMDEGYIFGFWPNKYRILHCDLSPKAMAIQIVR